MKLIDRLISQLNTLVAFLASSRLEVFEIIQQHYEQWFTSDTEEALPDSYSLYQTQVAHAAFVLGYSYAEAFFADLLREIYLIRPIALPREKELKFCDVLERSTYDEVLGYMIDKEVLAVMYNSIDKIIKYYEDKLNLQWPSSERDTIIEANLLRNCIVHNNAIADSRLATHCERWTDGTNITLTISDVHKFGITARATARNLYHQAEQKYLLQQET
jgi:hypothetical protein